MQFNDCGADYILPEKVATYVNEHKVKTVSEASSLGDGYILTHKSNLHEFSPRKDYYRREQQRSSHVNTGPHVRFKFGSGGKNKEGHFDICRECHKPGQFRRNCPDLARKQPTVSTREVGCVSSVSFAHVKSANADTGKLLHSGCSTVAGEGESLCVWCLGLFLTLITRRLLVTHVECQSKYCAQNSGFVNVEVTIAVHPSLPVDCIELDFGQ